MRKLRLDVEALAVDSFDVSGAAEGTGTVRGHSDTPCVEDDYTVLCGSAWTCQGTCHCTEATYCLQGSCVYTCGPQSTCAC